MKVVLSHPTGNQNVRQAILALLEEGMLGEFVTCIARRRESSLDVVLPARIRGELRRRAFDEQVLAKTHTRPWREWARLTALRLGLHNLTRPEIGRLSFDAIAEDLDRAVARRLDLAVHGAAYAYDGGAFHTFRAAEKRGIARVFELPTPHWRLKQRLSVEEAELRPEWACTLEALTDSPAKLERKDTEAQLADVIIAPSEFVRESLSECPDLTAPIAVVPYGCPRPSHAPPKRSERKLRLIYVGALTAGKGVHYLFEAVSGLDVELTLVGALPTAECPQLKAEIAKHRYLGPQPRERVLEEMRHHDLFVFPTLFEGLSLSLLEAISQGLVPITTPNSGAVGIIRDGENGFLTPIRDASAMAEKIQLLCANRSLLSDMKESALHTAAEHTWERYRRNLVDVVSSVGEMKA